MKSAGVATLGVAAAVGLGCRPGPDQPLGSPDSYLILRAAPAPGGGAAPAGLPVVQELAVDAPGAKDLAKLLSDGIGAQMLRSHHVVKQLMRELKIDGRGFCPGGCFQASGPTLFLLGRDQEASGQGLALASMLGKPTPRPREVWIGLPDDPARDRALRQTVSGRLALLTAELVASAGTFSDTPKPPRVLVEGYARAMEVIAREWREGEGPAGTVPTDAGTAHQRDVFSAVRENRYVGTFPGGLRPVRDMLSDPGVAATVIYRMAESKTVGHKVAPAAFYAPIASERLPPGVSPAAVLGPVVNFQLKLLGAWARSMLAGRPPRDIADLVTVYGAELPAEKAEAVRIFVVTTWGATVKTGGVSAVDAAKALPELTALAGEVTLGRRTLRDAEGTEGPAAPPAARGQ